MRHRLRGLLPLPLSLRGPRDVRDCRLVRHLALHRAGPRLLLQLRVQYFNLQPARPWIVLHIRLHRNRLHQQHLVRHNGNILVLVSAQRARSQLPECGVVPKHLLLLDQWLCDQPDVLHICAMLKPARLWIHVCQQQHDHKFFQLPLLPHPCGIAAH